MLYLKEKYIYLIEKYLDHTISDTEKDQLEKELAENAELQEELYLRRKIDQSVEDIDLYLATEKAWETYTKERWILASDTDEKKVLPKNHYFQPARWIAAAAIMLLVGLSILLGINKGNVSSQEIFEQYYSPFETMMSNDLVLNTSALEKAKRNYHEENYQDALLLFKNLPNSLNISTEKDFYMGLTFMELGMFNQAIDVLVPITDKTKFESLPHVYWYLGLCYLKTDQLEKAEETFRYIVDINSFNAEEANEILQHFPKFK
jgi:tetratricopeptide (TPR) repeat protein